MIEARTCTVDLGSSRSVPLTVTEDGAGRTVLLLHGRGGPRCVPPLCAADRQTGPPSGGVRVRAIGHRDAQASRGQVNSRSMTSAPRRSSGTITFR